MEQNYCREGNSFSAIAETFHNLWNLKCLISMSPVHNLLSPQFQSIYEQWLCCATILHSVRTWTCDYSQFPQHVYFNINLNCWLKI